MKWYECRPRLEEAITLLCWFWLLVTIAGGELGDYATWNRYVAYALALFWARGRHCWMRGYNTCAERAEKLIDNAVQESFENGLHKGQHPSQRAYQNMVTGIFRRVRVSSAEKN